MRPLLALTGVLLTAVLSGCAETPGPPSPEKVKTTLERLGADPDTFYFKQFIATSPVTGQPSTQVLVLVPDKDGKTYRIVDSQGEVFGDYDDFLSNNNLPDQPGAPPPG